jgi:aconitase B
MLNLLRLSIGVVLGLMLWTAMAQGQARPACDPQGKVKTPATVAGDVTRIDAAQGKVTVRQSDGTMHEFQASPETLKDLKVGGRIEAKLREAPSC